MARCRILIGHGWIDASTTSGCPARSKLLQAGFALIARALTIRRYGPRIMLACGLTSNAMTRLEVSSTQRHPRSRGLRTCALFSDVRFGSKADIARCQADVRFTPKSGHWNSAA